MGIFVGGEGGGGGGGGGTPVAATRKTVNALRLQDIGTAVDVNIATPDRFYDSTIDMPATTDIPDADMFMFSAQFRLTASNPPHELIWVSGKDWKAMVALTTTQQSQTSFDTASSRKVVTFFLRRTSASGGQSQQNLYLAKGADGVSLYVGDNNNSFDANIRVWRVHTISETVVTNVSGGLAARAFLYSNTTVLQNRSIVTTVVDQVIGEGIAKETFDVSSITYIGHSLTAGTYYITAFEGGTQSSPAWEARTHTAFPATVGVFTSAGTALGIDPGSVNHASRKIFVVAADDTKLWFYPTSTNGRDEIGYILEKIS